MGFDLIAWNGSMSMRGTDKEIVEQLLQCNADTAAYGLMLTEAQALALTESWSSSLRQTGRIEFGGDILKKLIGSFCDSPYISSGDYEETLQALIQMFYDAKNEMQDRIGDDRLLTYMKAAFDGPCRGSLELLAGSVLPQAAAAVRAGRPLPAPERLLNERGPGMGENEDV